MKLKNILFLVVFIVNAPVQAQEICPVSESDFKQKSAEIFEKAVLLLHKQFAALEAMLAA